MNFVFYMKQEIFKNFQAATVIYQTTSILLSLPHWIQYTSIRDENRDFRRSGKPLTNTRQDMYPLRNVSDLVYGKRLIKQNKAFTKI